jgi:hypothetical protein
MTDSRVPSAMRIGHDGLRRRDFVAHGRGRELGWDAYNHLSAVPHSPLPCAVNGGGGEITATGPWKKGGSRSLTTSTMRGSGWQPRLPVSVDGTLPIGRQLRLRRPGGDGVTPVGLGKFYARPRFRSRLLIAKLRTGCHLRSSVPRRSLQSAEKSSIQRVAQRSGSV